MEYCDMLPEYTEQKPYENVLYIEMNNEQRKYCFKIEDDTPLELYDLVVMAIETLYPDYRVKVITTNVTTGTPNCATIYLHDHSIEGGVCWNSSDFYYELEE